jgi:hypothetical protein
MIWTVLAAIALHNIEEAIWLPAWSRSSTGRWQRLRSAFAFRFSVVVLSALAVAVAILARRGAYGSLAYYLLAAYAAGQSLNIFAPHLAAAIATRSYAPGLGSGLFLVLPASGAFLTKFFTNPDFDWSRFLIVSIIFIPLVMLSIPLLLRIGGMICRNPGPR